MSLLMRKFAADIRRNTAVLVCMVMYCCYWQVAGYQQSALVLIGETSVLTCHVQTPVDWTFAGSSSTDFRMITKNGNLVDSKTLALKYELVAESRTLSYLRIYSSNIEDAGLYTCANVDGHEMKDSTNLFVFNSSWNTPNFRMKRTSALVGSAVLLECTASIEYPVDWNRRQFPFSRQERVCSNGQISQSLQHKFNITAPTPGEYNLAIKDVQLADSGIYVCVEDGGLGHRAVIALVRVYELRQSTTNETTCLGQQAVLSCFTNHPAPVWIHWDEDGNSYDVASSRKYSISKFLNGSVRLVINDVQFVDTGLYVCMVSGLSNDASVSTLNVERCQETQFVTTQLNGLHSAVTAAVITTVITLLLLLLLLLLTVVLTRQAVRLKMPTSIRTCPVRCWPTDDNDADSPDVHIQLSELSPCLLLTQTTGTQTQDPVDDRSMVECDTTRSSLQVEDSATPTIEVADVGRASLFLTDVQPQDPVEVDQNIPNATSQC